MLPPIVELEAEINRAVQQALAGEACLETLIGRIVLGRDPQPDDPAWPRWGQRMFMAAVDRWVAARAEPIERQRRRYRRTGPDLSDVWNEIEQLTHGRDPWWRANVPWTELATRLGLGDRQAMYHLVIRQGWLFRGKGRSRRIVRAVCLRCGEPEDPEQIRGRLCPSCAS